MSDPAAPTAEQPQTYRYRVRVLNGEAFDVASLNDWVSFWSVIIRDGYVVSSLGFIPYHAIASIVPLPTGNGGNVVALGQHLTTKP